MSKKKIMILGASILQLPAILKAKEMGLYTIAVDMDKKAVGFQHADLCLEISTIDTPKVLEAAKFHKIDGIMTLATDMPMRTVASVVKECNLIGITEDTALKATNKAIMRKCLKENMVPIPKYFCVNNYTDYIKVVQEFTDKFIVKPADNSGSRGVFLVGKKEDIDYAFEYSKEFSREGDVLVEEFMKGPEVSVETLTVDGQTHVIAITDKLTTGAPNFVEMGHSQPSRHPEEIKDQIKEIAIAAVKAIGIDNGPSHTEIIITKDCPKIVEIGARLGGDCITSHLVPLSNGIDMIKATINTALGETTNIEYKYEKGSAIKFFNLPNGVIYKIDGMDKARQIDGVAEVIFIKNIGDSVEKIKSSIDRVGYIIAQGADAMEAIKICEMVMDSISVNVN